MIAAEVSKEKGKALRYLAEPTKDCEGRKPGDECSIDHMRDYQMGMNVHHLSGVFNRALYIIATSPGWNIKKVFNIMVQANQFYWTSNSLLEQGACGVIQSARDYKYKTDAIIKAFDEVGLDANKC